MRDTEDTVTTEKVGGNIYGDTHAIYRDIAAGLLGTAPYPVKPEDAYALSVTLQAVRDSARSDAVVHPDYAG